MFKTLIVIAQLIVEIIRLFNKRIITKPVIKQNAKTFNKATVRENRTIQDVRKSRTSDPVGDKMIPTEKPSVIVPPKTPEKVTPLLDPKHKKQIEMALRYKNNATSKELADFDAETKRLRNEKEARLKKRMKPQDDTPPAA